MQAASGKAFRIFPLRIDPETGLAVQQGGRVEWFSPSDPLPEELEYDTWVFIRRSIDLIHDDIKKENWAEVSLILDKIVKYQHKVAADVLPSATHFRAEMLYNRISRPMVPFMASITLGMILFVITGIMMGRGRKTPAWMSNSMLVISIVLLAYLTLVLGLRWYVSGHAPFAGSYSVMMLMAWLVSIAMIVLYRSIPVITCRLQSADYSPHAGTAVTTSEHPCALHDGFLYAFRTCGPDRYNGTAHASGGIGQTA